MQRKEDRKLSRLSKKRRRRKGWKQTKKNAGNEWFRIISKRIIEKDKEENGGEIKVCFITAFEESYNEFKRLFPKLQIDCFIRKPISIDKLVETVKTKLDS
jgi:hypothetical protein